MATSVEFDPSLPAFLDDPYPFYQRLREADPVHWQARPQPRWVLTRYADVAEALRDPRLVKAGPRALLGDVPASVRPELGPLERSIAVQIDSINPPDHTRLRGLVHAAFTPHMVEARRPYIEQLAGELLDAVAGQGELDLIRDLAYPLPAAVIMAMLGVPRQDHDQLKEWADDYAALKGAGALGTDPGDAARRANASTVAFNEYMERLVDARRRQPRDDLLSALLAVAELGDRLSDEELISNCRLLLIAGHETTTNLIGNGMLALLQHPDQLAALRDDPSLVATAVEELLRYDSPSQMQFRWAAEDLELGGKAIARGQEVVIVAAAANRDPAEFPRPDAVDVRRTPNHHAAFGFGPHYCLGAPLARLEAQVVFPILLQRLPDVRLAEMPPQRAPNPVLRGLKSLPLAFSPTR